MKYHNSRIAGWIVVALAVTISFMDGYGQDTLPVRKNLKNTVRMNLTNPILFGEQCLIFGYERTIGKKQSFSINVGRFSMPKLLSFDTDSIQGLDKSFKSRGISVSADYRFYLPKLNRFDAPRGVYIGPYMSFNSFSRDYEMYANTESFTGELDMDFSFQVFTMGFQLGYQFVFWNRLSLDMILFGPGISSYSLKADLSTTLDPDEEAELFQKINDVLAEKIPGYSLVLEPGTFEKRGSVKTTSLGYRYVIMLGFRF